MKTATISLFCIKELSGKARERALETCRHWNVEDSDWWEYVYEEWKEKLAELGYNDVDIRFSGFWSQGDGASFTGKVDVHKWLESHNMKEKMSVGMFDDICNYFSVTVERLYGSRYVHEHTVDVVIGDNYCSTWTDELENLSDQIRCQIKDEVHDLSCEIYRDLEREYEGQVSDEAVIDSLEANEVLFDENGDQFCHPELLIAA